MYQIISTTRNTLLGYTEKIRYITKSENGSLIETNAMNAKGIAFLSVPYQLVGREELGGTYDVVMVGEIDTGESIEKLTPYTITKTAYIDDTEISFEDVPAGNRTVYTDKVIDYQINKQGSIITISFSPLEEITKITLSILKED